jgi:Tfp pilus assembly protein PilV
MTRKWFGRIDQRGLTLPETLVALVGLAIVGLGIVAVHVERLQMQPTSAWHDDAKILAEEMATIVRGTVQKTAQAGNSEVVRYENPIGVVCRTVVANLSANDMAANQVACWQNKVAAKLPNGSGTIVLDQATIPISYVIAVSWLQASGSTATYVVRSVLLTPPVTAN